MFCCWVIRDFDTLIINSRLPYIPESHVIGYSVCMRGLFISKCKVSTGFLHSVASVKFLSSEFFFFFIFLDWHTSKASLGWSYRYVQQMGQQCQALLWRRCCQTYGRVPGITWHHCAAVSNAGSWTTRQESGKLYHNAPKWSRQGNEPLFKVSWLFPCWIKYLQRTCFLDR